MIRLTQQLTLMMSAVLATISSAVSATDRHVPLPYFTIQSAINACVDGDAVMLQPGVYYENVNLLGKNITLRPFNTNFVSVIDGRDLGPTVKFSGAEGPTCVVRNLTIRNGTAGTGAGVQGNYTLATVKNCVISGNNATTGGGVSGMSGLFTLNTVSGNIAAAGAGIAYCEGVILDNDILNNAASQTGGGIAACSTGSIMLNSIKGNTAAIRGGGIYACAADIFGNIIESNSVTNVGSQASPGSFGGGIASCSGIIDSNLISLNTSNGVGGGVDSCSNLIRNNRIIQNSARNGGGISNCGGRLEHNTIFGNSAIFSGGGLLSCSSPVNSIIYKNMAPSSAQVFGPNGPMFSCVEGWPIVQSDIVTSDPGFVNRDKGDFHLLAISPCIDSGKLIADTTLDFEGEERPTTGAVSIGGGDGSRYDMGADEYRPPVIDLTGIWVSATTKYSGDPPNEVCKLSGSFLVRNDGNIPSLICTLKFYLSADTILDLSDTPIGLPVNLGILKPAKTKKTKVKVKLAPGVIVTDMYLIADVDSEDVVPEVDENDNSIPSPPLL